MHRKLFIALSLVVLLSLTTSMAFADPAETSDTIYTYGGETILGDFVEDVFVAFDPVTDEITPYTTVNIWMYRPDTEDGFDPRFPAEWDLANEYIKPWPESALRRQYQTVSDAFGFYYVRFMLPRNAAETWYPCGFPCRWQCNYLSTITGWEFHSPALLYFYYPDYRFTDPPKPYWPEPFWVMTHAPLFWPWDLDWVDPWLGWLPAYGPPPWYEHYWYPVGQDALPFDTVHPVEIWFTDPFGFAQNIWEVKLLGLSWQPTDTKVDDYLAEWPYICGDPYEWPDYDNLGTP